MIIKQLTVGFMEVFCYILGCEETHMGLLIDPAGDEEPFLRKQQNQGADRSKDIHACRRRSRLQFT